MDDVVFSDNMHTLYILQVRTQNTRFTQVHDYDS